MQLCRVLPTLLLLLALLLLLRAGMAAASRVAAAWRFLLLFKCLCLLLLECLELLECYSKQLFWSLWCMPSCCRERDGRWRYVCEGGPLGAFVLVVEELKILVVEVFVVSYRLVLVLVPTFADAGLLGTLCNVVPYALFPKDLPTITAQDLLI